MIGWALALQVVALPFNLVDLPSRPAEQATLARACAAGTDGEVVVCARRRDDYRLPLPDEARSAHDRVHGEPLRPDLVLAGNARCGIFAGERMCSKRDKVDYGYGNGRDPITVLGKVARSLAGDE